MRDLRMIPRALFASVAVLVAVLLVPVASVLGQDGKVQLTFLPPPLESATYSLGIYEAKTGKLTRRLHEIAGESAFAVGLNGLITKWDGQDDNGDPAPPGKYAARGYAVGPLQVEGVDILGNDWTSEDETLRIKHVEAMALVPDDGGLAVLATMADGGPALMRLSGEGKLLWRSKVRRAGTKPFILVANEIQVWESADDGPKFVEGFALSDGSEAASAPMTAMPAAHPGTSLGKDDTLWEFGDDFALIQKNLADGSVLRRLEAKPGEPPGREISASIAQDRLYLLEEKPGWQRLRGLSWLETKEENGKQVSTWQTFFERNIREPAPALGLAATPVAIEVELVENPLTPGKPAKARLSAAFDSKGSYLVCADGLRLATISERPNLRGVRLAAGKEPGAGTLAFYQTDDAAVDEFAIRGASRMMSFDAGEFELTAKGEKPTEGKAPEPPDL